MCLRFFILLLVATSGLFADNDYCVTCQDGKISICHSGPGGEVGRVGCGLLSPNCQITYFDSRSCKINAAAKVPNPATGPAWENWNHTVGGDCKGNQWCQLPLKVSASKTTIAVNEQVSIALNSGNLGSVDGHYHTVVNPPGGFVDWGDDSGMSGGGGTFTLAHKYKKPGTYTVRAFIQGEYHWSANDGSCSYECHAANKIVITVR